VSRRPARRKSHCPWFPGSCVDSLASWREEVRFQMTIIATGFDAFARTLLDPMVPALPARRSL
jgi:hypothetical protein